MRPKPSVEHAGQERAGAQVGAAEVDRDRVEPRRADRRRRRARSGRTCPAALTRIVGVPRSRPTSPDEPVHLARAATRRPDACPARRATRATRTPSRLERVRDRLADAATAAGHDRDARHPAAAVSRWKISVQLAGVDDALVVERHQRLEELAPAVVHLGVPEPVPGFLVSDLRVVEDDRVRDERRHLGDPGLLDLGHELGPDVVVILLVLARVRPARDGA